jgi:hypothetical protein
VQTLLEAHSAVAWCLDGSSVYHRMDDEFETPESWVALKAVMPDGFFDDQAIVFAEDFLSQLTLSERDDGVHEDKACGEGFIKNEFECSIANAGLGTGVALASGAAAYLLLRNSSPELRAFASIGAGIAVGAIAVSALSSAKRAETQRPKLVKDIKYDAFGRPIFPERKGWKSEMTLEEAEEWTKDSVVKESVFHGTTSTEFKDSIKTKGFDLEQSARGELSDGVYLTRDRLEALKYTQDINRKKSESRVLEVRPNISRPLLLGSGYQYHFPEQAIEGMGQGSLAFQYEQAHKAALLSKTGNKKLSSVEQGIVIAKAQRDTFRALGFDSIYTSNLGWVIAFDPKSLTVINSSKRTDDNTPIKRTIFWKGFEIGLQYQPFDLRHDKLLPCGYGEIVGTNGQDGMALDCYVGSDLESDRVFVIDQLNAQTGEFDEHKLFIGFDDDAAAIKDLFVSLMGQERFGGIRETVPAKVWDLHEDSEHVDQEQPKVDAEDVLDDFDINIDADEIVLDWGENAGVFAEVLNAE